MHRADQPRATLVALDRRALGVALMVSASLSVSLVDGIAKHLTADHSPFLISWARYVFASLFVLPVFSMRHRGTLWPNAGISAHVVRTIFIASAMTCFFSAIATIPLATALGGFLVGPVIASLLAIPVLGEPLTRAKMLAAGVGFLGALLIVQPGFDSRVGSLLALAGGGFLACYLVATRKAAQADPPLVTLALQCGCGALLLTPLALWHWSWPSSQALLFMAAMGLLSAICHMLVIAAFRRAEASVLSPLVYFELVSATAIGMAVFKELPTARTWTGIAAIIVAGLLLARREGACP